MSSLRTAIDQTMILKGERSKLKDLLRVRLSECDWRNDITELCRDEIKQNPDGSSLTVEQLVHEVAPTARAMVPDSVKRELLLRIRASLDAHENN